MTTGDVLEIGMGLYSTPFLHWACFNKRKLVSYDNDAEYFNMNKQYEEGLHEVHFVDDWDSMDIEKPWDVVLVDHGPSERRIVDIKKLANLARFIVVHDTEGRSDHNYHFSTVFPSFKYKYTFTKSRPHTTILSNFVDVTNFEV